MSHSDSRSAPPALELDLAYSIPEMKSSLSLKIPPGYFSGGRGPFLFPLRTLRVWRIRLRAWRDARKGIHGGMGRTPAVLEEIQHQGQLKFNELSSEFCEKIASEVPRQIHELVPAPFFLEEQKKALSNSLQGWLRGYREYLLRMRADLRQARGELVQAEEALESYTTEERIPRRPRLRRKASSTVVPILFFVAMETVLGMVLFGKEEEAVIDSGLVALLISASNAFLGWFLGFFGIYQLLDGTRNWHRIAGGAFCLLNAAAALVTNLMVAQLRDKGAPDLELLLPMSPFGVVLFIAGLGIWGLAAIKGYRNFTPGKLRHRELWDEWKSRRQVFDLVQASYRTLLLALQQVTEQKAQQLRDKVERFVAAHEVRRDQIKGLVCSYDCLKAQLEICRNGVRDSVRVLHSHYWEVVDLHVARRSQAGGALPSSPRPVWEPEESYVLTRVGMAELAAEARINSNIEAIRRLLLELEEEFAVALRDTIPGILREFPPEGEEEPAPRRVGGQARPTVLNGTGGAGASAALAVSGGGV